MCDPTLPPRGQAFICRESKTPVFFLLFFGPGAGGRPLEEVTQDSSGVGSFLEKVL